MGRSMIFNTFQDNDKLEELGEITTRYLNGKTVGELYNYIKKFGQGYSEYTLFKSIMQMIVIEEEEGIRSKRLIKNEVLPPLSLSSRSPEPLAAGSMLWTALATFMRMFGTGSYWRVTITGRKSLLMTSRGNTGAKEAIPNKGVSL